MRARSKIVALFFALVTIVACEAPTLPLPPPEVPSIAPSTQAGHYKLSAVRGAEADALIIIYNTDTNVPNDQRVSGTQADGLGTWDADVLASPGDYLEITQQYGTTDSPSITVQIPQSP